MEPTSHSTLSTPRELQLEDAACCCTLSDEAGWNQTLEDWKYIITHSAAFGIVNGSGQIVATTVAFTVEKMRWIAMVLVARSCRGQGLASVLLDRLAVGNFPDHTDYLDATSLGAPLYRKRGFCGMETVLRHKGMGTGSGRLPQILPDGMRYLGDCPNMISIDGAAPWSPGILEYSHTSAPASCFVMDHKGGHGMIWARPGRLAWQVGPIVATDTHIAELLFATCLKTLHGPVFIDVPTGRKGMLAVVGQKGFVVSRKFERMRCGPSVEPESPALNRYATAGPDFG